MIQGRIRVDEQDRKSLAELCNDAGVRMRVSGMGVHDKRVVISDSYPTAVGFTPERDKLSIISTDDILTDYPALRILEILAYGFFDYVARECLCAHPEDYFDLSDCIDSDWDANVR